MKDNSINAIRPTNNQVTAATQQVMQKKDSWTGVNGRIWRHTIGRVSNLARIPINVWGVLVQGGKVITQTILLPLTYTALSLYSLGSKIRAKINKHPNTFFRPTDYKGPMSIRGIGLEIVGLAEMTKRTGLCFKNVIVAPSRESSDFVDGVAGIGKITILGELHAKELESTPISLMLKRVFSNRNHINFVSRNS